MSNRRELLNARRDVEHAASILAAIERLPRRKGSLVIWTNGIVWRRLGDDSWEALHRDNGWQSDTETYGTFPSAHVASAAGTWNSVTQIKRLPDSVGLSE
jgi:hypothetical protein